MNAAELCTDLQTRFGPGVLGVNLEAIDPWIELAPEALLPVCQFLRDEPSLQFNLLNCITGVDFCHTDPKKAAKSSWQPHLEVVYHLSSLARRHRLVLKLTRPRWKDGIVGQLPAVPSVTGIWKTALWHEREVYDLVGVWFDGHPDLRRILCPEDWVGHPLRKDYEMPLEYHGIRGR
ncbi:MAG: NADH-quinone oxidoreductase subunit C [Candidatus Anammoximicrobium sp.]|nr:NADH-quinone oxidoreductase subunit C [Candidatus Anammoximicrobium sp.]